MTQSKDLLNDHFRLADAIKECIGNWPPSLAVSIVIKACNRALSQDEMRMLQYAIQRKDAPADPVEAAWYEGRLAEEQAMEEAAEKASV
jgi:hypothetical protein